jgi:alkylation response protein AidB-like acyl-CoA dehydrogenase
MELAFTAEQEAFRAEARAWIDQAMPEDIRAKAAIDAPFEHEEIMRWHRILYQKGWSAFNWPKQYGGAGLDPTSRFILTEELTSAGAPELSAFGVYMVGPLLIQFGSPAQKERFLPKILSGEEVWCQGYSEPNAGSDLASLRTSAVRDADGNYLVNGQKTWTTHAQYADWIFCLVRTDSSGKKQEGISFLLIDMKSPGIEARPMLTIGGTPGFCDTFFDNVVVPAENLVGPLGGGWTLAKALLGHERTVIANVGGSQRVVRRIKRIAAQTTSGGRPLIEHPLFRARLAQLEIKLRGLQMTNYRALASAQLGRAPGPESSILKIRGTEIQQEALELAMDIMGHDSLTWFNPPGVVPEIEAFIPQRFNYMRAATIYGGSNEIQRNVIAKYILGLPTN